MNSDHFILDARLRMVKVGYTVVYVEAPTISRDRKEIKITSPTMKFARVKSIVVDDFPGFAEAGREITVTLEDGHVTKGDSENGGWDILKLEQWE